MKEISAALANDTYEQAYLTLNELLEDAENENKRNTFILLREHAIISP